MKNFKKIVAILMAMAIGASFTTAFADEVETPTEVIENTQVDADDVEDIDIIVDEVKLVRDVDYTLEYKDNVEVGTATIIVHFIGNYSGEAERTFEIEKKSTGGGGGGGSSSSAFIYNISIKDKDGNPVNGAVTKEKDNKLYVTLPAGTEMSDDNSFVITVTNSRNGKPVENKVVNMADRFEHSAEGTTDSNGQVILPDGKMPETTPSSDIGEHTTDRSVHSPYISGYDDGSFMPDNNISRSETAAIIYRTLQERYSEGFEALTEKMEEYFTEKFANGELTEDTGLQLLGGFSDMTTTDMENVSEEMSNLLNDFYAIIEDTLPFSIGETQNFSDLVQGAWYEDSILALSSIGIINGYEDGTFKPDSPITRAEFTTMLMQNSDIQEFNEADNPFPDLKASHYAADYIYTAYNMGIITGYEDGTFKPDSPITRAEAVTILNGVLGRTDLPYDILPFNDVSMNHWAYRQIVEASIERSVINE